MEQVSLSTALQMLNLQELILEQQKPSCRDADSGSGDDPLYREEITRKLEAAFSDLVEAADVTTTFEIGAHEAAFSLETASRLNDVDCYAFEANPAVYSRFKNEAGKRGVVYLNQAISKGASQTVFRVPVKENGKTAKTLGSLSQDGNFQNFEEYVVDAVSLDSHVAGISRNCALWIDVEGHAGEVLEGADEVLRLTDAIYIEMETIPRWHQQKTDLQIMRKLLDLGFVPVLRDIQRPKWQYNAIFVHHSKLQSAAVKTVIDNWSAGLFVVDRKFRASDAPAVRKRLSAK